MMGTIRSFTRQPEEYKLEFLIFDKLKDFYAQPMDGCWPLRPCWVPDLNRAPKHVKSMDGERVTSFRRFTFEEFLQILEIKKRK